MSNDLHGWCPISWNDPNAQPGSDPELVLKLEGSREPSALQGRDGEPITDSAGQPIPVSVFPPAVDGATYHFHMRQPAPDSGEVLKATAALSEQARGIHVALSTLLSEQRTLIMASHAELRAEIDALRGNVQRVAEEHGRRLDELAQLRDNGSEQEQDAAVAELRALNGQLAGIGAAPAPAPVDAAAPAPVDAAPVDAAPAPVDAAPAPDVAASLPAPDAPPADPTAPVEPGSPTNPAT